MLYPEIDISDLKNFPRECGLLSHPIWLQKSVEWSLIDIIDECKGLEVERVKSEKTRVKILEPIQLYGVFKDGSLYVKTKGMRKRKTSLKRLQQLGSLRVINDGA